VFDAAASSGPETSGPLRVARDARDSLFSPVSGFKLHTADYLTSHEPPKHGRPPIMSPQSLYVLR
jgi:hypothetical protein